LTTNDPRGPLELQEEKNDHNPAQSSGTSNTIFSVAETPVSAILLKREHRNWGFGDRVGSSSRVNNS